MSKMRKIWRYSSPSESNGHRIRSNQEITLPKTFSMAYTSIPTSATSEIGSFVSRLDVFSTLKDPIGQCVKTPFATCLRPQLPPRAWISPGGTPLIVASDHLMASFELGPVVVRQTASRGMAQGLVEGMVNTSWMSETRLGMENSNDTKQDCYYTSMPAQLTYRRCPW
jgi:hypothetical protein